MKATVANPYPKTFEEFLRWFQSELDCREYLEWVRWPEGVTCLSCGSRKVWRTDRGLYHCGDCQHQTSPTAGTVFESSRKPLLLWFHVMWLMMSQKNGLSAQTLCDTYGFGSYQTAWAWLQKFRGVMIRPGREKLQGRVEVDEAYFGGHQKGVRGRGSKGKTMVLVAAEGQRRELGRVRFRCVDVASSENLKHFILDYVDPEAVVVTDGLTAYRGITKLGFTHEVHEIKANKDQALSELEHVHLVVSLVKRWLLGTHQGAVRPSHLEEYLDEFAFRFNRRLSEYRGNLFYRLMQQSVLSRPSNVKGMYTTVPQHIGGT